MKQQTFVGEAAEDCRRSIIEVAAEDMDEAAEDTSVAVEDVVEAL